MKVLAILLGALLLAGMGVEAGRPESEAYAAESEWYFPEWLARALQHGR